MTLEVLLSLRLLTYLMLRIELAHVRQSSSKLGSALTQSLISKDSRSLLGRSRASGS